MKRSAIFLCLATLFIFTGIIGPVKNQEGVIYWNGDMDKDEIALTFDDGPNDPYTSQVLDTLKSYRIKATFFLIGKRVEEHPDIARRIVKEGHAIGNHTYGHPDLRFEPARIVRTQMRDGEGAIFKATAKKPFLFRPPYGGRNATIMEEAKSLGYVVIEYSVSGRDGGKTRISPETIVKNVLVKAHSGSIILLHDGDNYEPRANRAPTAKALPLIIESLEKKGYKFVTVPELLGLEDER